MPNKFDTMKKSEIDEKELPISYRDEREDLSSVYEEEIYETEANETEVPEDENW